ncbi:unnamed protein product [Rhizophagus irregularis]|uniref:Uncharacterized protein n=1 Tax=Rhizophagus irregularis TaxID=588596 RepID=A0A915ZXH0_9GLOM|nr:unnamed protein product [Rhizophagus irregularis]
MGKPDLSNSKIQNRIKNFKEFSIWFLNRVQTGSTVIIKGYLTVLINRLVSSPHQKKDVHWQSKLPKLPSVFEQGHLG